MRKHRAQAVARVLAANFDPDLLKVGGNLTCRNRSQAKGTIKRRFLATYESGYSV
jgi:hypothetical protein